MYLLPAIDLKQGKCVRLKQGDMAQATVFNDNPAAQAESFASQGAEWIHIVDLDGAFAGKPVNAQAVENILNAVDVKIELGGGIRTLETIQMWLDKGVARVILGTIALRDPDFVKQACREFPGRIAVGIDAKDGFVAVEGWAEKSGITAVDLARQFESAGVSAIIYTDVARDGVLQGPNLAATVRPQPFPRRSLYRAGFLRWTTSEPVKKKNKTILPALLRGGRFMTTALLCAKLSGC